MKNIKKYMSSELNYLRDQLYEPPDRKIYVNEKVKSLEEFLNDYSGSGRVKYIRKRKFDRT